jgi:uncharacterized protein
MEKPLIAKLAKIGELYGIAAIYASGSRAEEIASMLRGEESFSSHPQSDVNIGIQMIMGQRLSVKDEVQLTNELEDLFSASRVDLLVVSEAKPFLALDIIRGELLYCWDLDEQAKDELYILRRAGDLAYFERERIRQTLGIGQ